MVQQIGLAYAEARKREEHEAASNTKDYSGNADNLSAQGITTNEQMAMKNIIVDNSIKAVLGEQEKQETDFFEANEYNDNPDTVLELDNEEIAQKYHAHSNVSLQQAQKRARHLAQNLKTRESSPERTPRPRQLSSRSGSSWCSSSDKSKMSLVRRRTQYGRHPLVRRGDVPQVLKCTTPAA